jgi:NAD(P)-dependent dehydrogenase (short-subunit alcohol dehydrogenase family)
MMADQADTVAVIGGAGEIGAATARRLASNGHRVITVDVRDADIVGDLGTADGRQDAVARLRRLAEGGLDGLVVIPRAVGYEAGAGAVVVSTNYFGSVAVLEGLQPTLARSGHAAVVVGTMWSSVPSSWPEELERLCFRGDEDGARCLANTIDAASALAASTAALARYVRRHALTSDWIRAAIRLNTVSPGIVDAPRLDDDLNNGQSIRDLERFRAVAEAVAARIIFVLGPEAHALWRSAIEAEVHVVGAASSGAGTHARHPSRSVPSMSRRGWLNAHGLVGEAGRIPAAVRAARRPPARPQAGRRGA